MGMEISGGFGVRGVGWRSTRQLRLCSISHKQDWNLKGTWFLVSFLRVLESLKAFGWCFGSFFSFAISSFG